MNDNFTKESKISDVVHDAAFGDYGRLLFPTDAGYFSGGRLGELNLTWYEHIDADKTVEILNYLKDRAKAGKQVFYDIYSNTEKAADSSFSVIISRDASNRERSAFLRFLIILLIKIFSHFLLQKQTAFYSSLFF